MLLQTSLCRASLTAALPRSSVLSLSRADSPVRAPYTTMASATSFFDFQPKDKKGEPFDLAQLHGQVVLVVNTASKCGFTPQFDGLEKLHQDLSKRYPGRFTVLGFPCNQFAAQDPGTDDDIQSFCRLNYGVSFPVLAKVDVNGGGAAPVWEWLKGQRPGLFGMKRVKWNFEKFLVGSDGQVLNRWASTTKPESLKDDILKALEKGGPPAEGTKTEAKPDATAEAKPEAKAEL